MPDAKAPAMLLDVVIAKQLGALILALCVRFIRRGCQSLAGIALHSITSSARARTAPGMIRPRAFAVPRLTTNSKWVGTSSGRSAGREPRKIWATRKPALLPISLCLGPYDIR